jgi:membrane protein implicated in regulation of membrane protease activity
MQKSRILLILGAWMAVLPYLGFPYAWKEVLFTISGLIVVYLSYFLYKDYKKKEGKTFDNFSENGDFKEIEKEIEIAREEPIEQTTLN